MEYIFLVLTITITILIYSLICIVGISKGYEYDNNLFVFILVVYPILVLFALVPFISEPKAIDVYKGKTTLEITYKDKVPIDSTVVWKNK